MRNVLVGATEVVEARVVRSTGSKTDMGIDFTVVRKPKKRPATGGRKIMPNGASKCIIRQVRDGTRVAKCRGKANIGGSSKVASVRQGGIKVEGAQRSQQNRKFRISHRGEPVMQVEARRVRGHDPGNRCMLTARVRVEGRETLG